MPLTPSSPDSAPAPRLRLFFALWLPDDIRATLAALRPPPRSAGAGAYRWVDPRLLHVTLAFLGSQPTSILEDLRHTAANAAAGGRRARLTLGDAGSFGPARAPRVLWVGLAGDLSALVGLQRHLAAGLRDLGVRIEERAFSPHITLARRRENARSSGPPPWPPARPVRRTAVPLDEIVLVRSDLSPSGPRYTVLEAFPVGTRSAEDAGRSTDSGTPGGL